MLTAPRKRVLRVVTTKEGVRLNVVGYRIPPPGYQTANCSGVIDRAHPDDIVEGVWSAALDSQHFRRALAAIAPGIVEAVDADARIGIGISGPSGARVAMLCKWAQEQELTQLLMRATDIDRDADADRFAAAWGDPARRADLRALAASFLAKHGHDAAKKFDRDLKAIGLTAMARPGAVSGQREQLRRIINGARIGGGGCGNSRVRRRTGGGCGGCGGGPDGVAKRLQELSNQIDAVKKEAMRDAPDSA